MEWKNPLATKYGITSLPRAILVDQNGIVIDTVARGERLIQHLQQLLGPPGGSLGGVGQLDEEETSDSEVAPASFDEPVQLEQGAGAPAAP
jgi:hypothetical protein